MAIVLSLITAAVFGIGDFCGGIAAKRARVLQVVAGSHLVGAVGATIAALVLADGHGGTVLSALYPISTVILARLILSERMTRTQGLGFAAAIAATELLVTG